MGKKRSRRRGRYHRPKATAKEIAFLTRGMAGINVLAIARKLGLGKDDDTVIRAIKSSDS